MKNAGVKSCVVNASGDHYMAKQGYPHHTGISKHTTGAQGICMHVVTIPPGGVERAHLHENHETAIYVLAGTAEALYGDGLKEHLTVRTGDFLYIPPNVPHLPWNASETQPCVVVLSRTDPSEQESVVLLPELEKARMPEIEKRRQAQRA